MRILKFYPAILLLLFSAKVKAQQIPCIDSINYSCIDLLHPIAGIQIRSDSANGLIKKYFYGKPGNSPVDFNANDSSCSNAGDSLFFTVTYPSNYNYGNCSPLPCIVLFHPGGFKESSSLKNFEKYAEAFALRAYIVFNVEYRTGYESKPPGVNVNGTSQMIASYRAYQDIRGALKSIVRMNEMNSFPNFNFDLNKLYIGGASAGSFMSINVAYINQNEINQVFPGADSVLGKLNSPLVGKYVGSGTPLPGIKGVMGLWGAGPGLPDTIPSFIKASDTIPFIGFHGERDQVAPFDRRDEFYSDDSLYAAITQCSGSMAVHFDIRGYDNDPSADITTFGGYGIYKRLKQLGVPTEIYLDSDMAHGLNDNTSNFGLRTSNNNDVISYIAGRTATFFQAVASGTFNDSITKFEDCENPRKGCETPTYPCAASRPAKSTPVVSVVKENLSEGLKISPNPASAFLRIEMQNREIISGIRVYNLQGQLLLQKKPGNYSSVINRSEISSSTGVCIVEVVTATQTIRKKVLMP